MFKLCGWLQYRMERDKKVACLTFSDRIFGICMKTFAICLLGQPFTKHSALRKCFTGKNIAIFFIGENVNHSEIIQYTAN